MNRTISWILLAFILAACSGNQATAALPPTTAPSATAYPTYTPLPPLDTLTPYPTYTQAPTQTAVVIVVTATGPLYTLTPRTVPTKTPIPSPNVEPVNTKDKTEGVYLVGEEVAPGHILAHRQEATQPPCGRATCAI